MSVNKSKTNQVMNSNTKSATGYEVDDIWIFPSESQVAWNLYTTLEQSYSSGKKSIFAKILDWIIDR